MKQKACDNAIRNQYQKMGVEQFYQEKGSDYSNPHFLYIKELLLNNKGRINYNRTLDLCAGAGEVTQVLQELNFNATEGCDPFTQEAFEKNTRKKCLSFSFDDIIKNGLDKKYTSIICSFAMHLCEKGKLFPLVSKLFSSTKELIIITPHKRPELELLEGVVLNFEDFVFTERGKKVKLKSYSHLFIHPEME